jgi:hypothetical protein
VVCRATPSCTSRSRQVRLLVQAYLSFKSTIEQARKNDFPLDEKLEETERPLPLLGDLTE